MRAQGAADAVSGRPADAVGRDEDFWFNVRHAFTVDRNIVNLNNGGVSPSPKVGMDTGIPYLEMENMNPRYYTWRILDPALATARWRPAPAFRCHTRANHTPR